MNEKHAHDDLSIDLSEHGPKPLKLTDLLKRVCMKSLEKNRSMIDNNLDIRSITITVKLNALQVPYKVFVTPVHEQDIGRA